MASFISAQQSYQPHDLSQIDHSKEPLRQTSNHIYTVEENDQFGTEHEKEQDEHQNNHKEPESIPPMIEMSSSSNENNDSPRDIELYDESQIGAYFTLLIITYVSYVTYDSLSLIVLNESPKRRITYFTRWCRRGYIYSWRYT